MDIFITLFVSLIIAFLLGGIGLVTALAIYEILNEYGKNNDKF